jgi:hypothetical protein
LSSATNEAPTLHTPPPPTDPHRCGRMSRRASSTTILDLWLSLRELCDFYTGHESKIAGYAALVVRRGAWRRRCPDLGARVKARGAIPAKALLAFHSPASELVGVLLGGRRAHWSLGRPICTAAVHRRVVDRTAPSSKISAKSRADWGAGRRGHLLTPTRTPEVGTNGAYRSTAPSRCATLTDLGRRTLAPLSRFSGTLARQGIQAILPFGSSRRDSRDVALTKQHARSTSGGGADLGDHQPKAASIPRGNHGSKIAGRGCKPITPSGPPGAPAAGRVETPHSPAMATRPPHSAITECPCRHHAPNTRQSCASRPGNPWSRLSPFWDMRDSGHRRSRSEFCILPGQGQIPELPERSPKDRITWAHAEGPAGQGGSATWRRSSRGPAVQDPPPGPAHRGRYVRNVVFRSAASCRPRGRLGISGALVGRTPQPSAGRRA